MSTDRLIDWPYVIVSFHPKARLDHRVQIERYRTIGEADKDMIRLEKNKSVAHLELLVFVRSPR